MCGIVGFVNYKQDISRYRNILINMNDSISKRGPDEEGYYIKNHVALGHKRLIVIDPDGGKQPMLAMAEKESVPNLLKGQKKNRYKIAAGQKKNRPQIALFASSIMGKFTTQKN